MIWVLDQQAILVSLERQRTRFSLISSEFKSVPACAPELNPIHSLPVQLLQL